MTLTSFRFTTPFPSNLNPSRNSPLPTYFHPIIHHHSLTLFLPNPAYPRFHHPPLLVPVVESLLYRDLISTCTNLPLSRFAQLHHYTIRLIPLLLPATILLPARKHLTKPEFCLTANKRLMLGLGDHTGTNMFSLTPNHLAQKISPPSKRRNLITLLAYEEENVRKPLARPHPVRQPKNLQSL